jgi:hypothetical protein
MQRVDVYLSSTVLNSCVLCTRTVKNRKFWVWTVVDFAVSVAVGVAAAAVVAAFISVLAPVVTVGLPVAIVATAVVGIGIGIGVEASSIPTLAKSWINSVFSQK